MGPGMLVAPHFRHAALSRPHRLVLVQKARNLPSQLPSLHQLTHRTGIIKELQLKLFRQRVPLQGLTPRQDTAGCVPLAWRG
jgi:hypothetical protein